LASTLALVGSESLMGREIRDVLAGNALGQDLKLVAAGTEEAGKLTEHSGEPAFVAALEAENLESARLIFLAGSPDSVRKVRKLAPRAHLIDLSYVAEEMPNARLRAPMVEPAGYRAAAGSVHVIANAAAIAIALVLNRLGASHKLRRALAHVFEPASERGVAALEELQKQTVSLLSFKGQP